MPTAKSIFLVRRPPELAADKATDERGRCACAPGLASGWAKNAGGDLPGPADDAAANGCRHRRRLQLFLETGASPLISACRVDGMRHPRDMYRKRKDGHGELFIPDPYDRRTRHDYEELYQRNGAIYMVSFDYFQMEGRLRALTPVIYEMPWERSINVDGPGDLLIAKALIESGLVNAEPSSG